MTEREGKGGGKRALALGQNINMQGLLCFFHIQTEGAAYSIFHFCSFVPVPICISSSVSKLLSLNARLSLCYFTTEVFLLLPSPLLLPNNCGLSYDNPVGFDTCSLLGYYTKTNLTSTWEPIEGY